MWIINFVNFEPLIKVREIFIDVFSWKNSIYQMAAKYSELDFF